MFTQRYPLTSIMCAFCVLAAASVTTLQAKDKSSDAKFNVVETAAIAGQFKTLLTAVGAADLIETLRGEGPFTIFAPTDAAFAKLPKDVVADLLKPENKKKLAAILTYHVVAGNVKAEQAVKLSSAKTVNGKSLKLKVESGDLKINNAKVIKPDVFATNGTIHVIDSVLLPPSDSKHASKYDAAERLIKKAISAGVPQYNRGNHHACADIYGITAAALLEMNVPADFKEILMKAEKQAAKQHLAGSRAWTYRNAFDTILKKTHSLALMN